MTLNGQHAVLEALEHGVQGTIYIHKDHKKYKHLLYLATRTHSHIEHLSIAELKQRGARQGILFEVSNSPNYYVPNLKYWLSEKKSSNLGLIIVDHITDPQNLGAIMRTSLLFDIDLMILPQNRTAPENEICARSASGAMTVLPRCYENNLLNALKLLQENDIWVYSMDSRGLPIHTVELPSRCAFILGNEHKGISKILLEKSDELIAIPNNNRLDSFNVSVSASIACYEYYTQRRN